MSPRDEFGLEEDELPDIPWTRPGLSPVTRAAARTTLGHPRATAPQQFRDDGHFDASYDDDSSRAVPAVRRGKKNSPKAVIPGTGGTTYMDVVPHFFLEIMKRKQCTIDKVNKSSVVRDVRKEYIEAWRGKNLGDGGRLATNTLKKCLTDFKKSEGVAGKSGHTRPAHTPAQAILSEIVVLERELLRREKQVKPADAGQVSGGDLMSSLLSKDPAISRIRDQQQDEDTYTGRTSREEGGDDYLNEPHNMTPGRRGEWEEPYQQNMNTGRSSEEEEVGGERGERGLGCGLGTTRVRRGREGYEAVRPLVPPGQRLSSVFDNRGLADAAAERRERRLQLQDGGELRDHGNSQESGQKSEPNYIQGMATKRVQRNRGKNTLSQMNTMTETFFTASNSFELEAKKLRLDVGEDFQKKIEERKLKVEEDKIKLEERQSRRDSQQDMLQTLVFSKILQGNSGDAVSLQPTPQPQPPQLQPPQLQPPQIQPTPTTANVKDPAVDFAAEVSLESMADLKRDLKEYMELEELSGVLLQANGQLLKISTTKALPEGRLSVELFNSRGKNYAKIYSAMD